MSMLRGWLLDLYADDLRGLVVWVLGEDGQRHQLLHDFPVSFYASGNPETLRELWVYLRNHKILHRRERVRKADSTGREYDLLAVTVLNPAFVGRLFREVEKRFPQLDYFNCDLSLTLRFAAAYDVFPMSHCEMEVERGRIRSLRPLDDRWALYPHRPTLKVLRIFPDADPRRERPSVLHVQSEQRSYEIPLKSARELVSTLGGLIDAEDPDLVMSDYGDTWLFPLLRRILDKHPQLRFNPNRDKSRPPRHLKANSYFSYGHVVYRGEQTHFFGRWHIDRHNGMSYGEYGAPGAIEQANMCGVPVQEMARKSPGAGITAMFTLTSLRRGVLVPNEKLHVERPKTLRQLFVADKGGLIYQPTLGLHYNVLQIDYSSMYPSIMHLWNVSPETVGVAGEMVRKVPEIDIAIDQSKPGVVAETLGPLLQKRLAMKAMLKEMDPESIEYKLLDARNSSLKWLLVVCFGYQGYKNFREGRIEAHEAITAFSRAALFRTMRIAETLGYQVLHMYVDSLWLKRADERPISAEEEREVLRQVEEQVGLPISTEARYRWVAFLPASTDPEVPVPNRYFGELEDGSFKVRGTASRRHDTPPLLMEIEAEILECMASGTGRQVGEVVARLQERVRQLRALEVPLDQLVVRVNISRPPEEYRVRSSAAVAGQQLQQEGKPVAAGQLVRFVYVRGFPRVYAWDSVRPLDMRRLDVQRYIEMTLRMAASLLQPLGVTEAMLWDWVVHKAWYGQGPERFQPGQREALPLLAELAPSGHLAATV
ncbi:MAG: hypothetical protein KF698_08235 [Anaerolineales bacterium]|nr:hypothetical protein [Anaerolineales bacterium]